MIHFHVTKEVFQEIKFGKKKIEFRPDIPRYNKPLKGFKNNGELLACRFYSGYPKKDDEERILNGLITNVSFYSFGHCQVDHRFYQYYPNYKGDWIIGIEFFITDLPLIDVLDFGILN